jgi:hypothetical protein
MSWNELFYYKEGFLYYKSDVGRKIKKDSKVGNIKKSGYLQFNSNNKTYSVHRVIYEMHFGKIPEKMQIDHIDRDKLNNNIGNLRLATSQQNNFNKNVRKDSSSGFKCIFWRKDKNKYRVRIKINNTEKSVGYFKTIEEAKYAYEVASKQLHGEFAYIK